jgi:hypothetical protein
MRDPELVARAQHAAARLEAVWERWRALQGLGEPPAQPVVGYVGYALKEPWGQPRAVIGFSADEAERLADYLEHGISEARAQALAQQQAAGLAATGASGGQPPAPSFTPSRQTAGQPTLADLGADRSLPSLRPSYQVLSVNPASYKKPMTD